MTFPILAGDAILGGLRGENRRIEDKFVSMGMEMKPVHIHLDLSHQQGNQSLYFYITCFRLVLCFFNNLCFVFEIQISYLEFMHFEKVASTDLGCLDGSA